MLQELLDYINQLDPVLNLKHANAQGGGCISQAYRLEAENGSYFLKVNRVQLLDMFEAEYLGLKEMQQTATIRVPQPLMTGAYGSHAFILMEDCPMGGSGDWATMGQQLAQMHEHRQSQHGWVRDNTLGATPQPNACTSDWVEFYSKYRLGFQVKLARNKGLGLRQAEQLMDRLGDFFDEQPQPSLLHGDLWSGNASFTHDKTPIIFDPATHYGDRECDLAMTELFGGFPSDFYQGYNEVWSIPKGYELRRDLYQLYHILNHYNLFGGGYGQQSERLIQNLLSA